MPELHISDELLDRYASGTLPEQRLTDLEEHLLFCQACQSRLEASDEFAMLFREAAVQPDTRSHRSWRLLWSHPAARWTVAAAAALAVLLLMAVPHRPPVPPATVFLQSLRGPETPAQIAAGRPALLVFDLAPAAKVNEYEARVVNPVGIEIVTAAVSMQNGHLAVLLDKLPQGTYWVRVFRTDSRDPIAEYGLRVN